MTGVQTCALPIYPGLMLKNRASLFPLGMMVVRIPVGDDDSVGE